MSAVILRTLAEASIRVVFLAAAVGAVLAVLRVRSSAVRHAAWTAVACAMLMMPMLQQVAPTIAVPVPRPASGTFIPGDVASAETQASVAAAAIDERAPAGVQRVDRSGPEPNAPPIRWPLVFIVVYVAGVAVLLVRAWCGWRRAAQIARAAAPIDLLDDAFTTDAAAIRIGESAAVVTPVTVGLLRPVVLLPLERGDWTSGALRCVLAHERAHVRRRDPLVNAIAQFNRCVFWFHPLAWWLARAVASMAEHAADADAVRSSGNREHYASTLVSMAHAVRVHRGRLARHGIGIHGGGLLARRIERVLDGSLHAACSRPRILAIASSGAMALLVAAGCRAASVRSVTADDVREQALRLMIREISAAPAADVRRQRLESGDRDIAILEDAARRNPDDLDTLKQLLVAYWVRPPATPRRRDAVLAVIERHPGSALAGSVESRLFPRRLDPSLVGDSEGYGRAKRVWLAHAERPDASASVLANASLFFETSEPALAERLLHRGESLHPDRSWPVRLGRLYAIVLSGWNAPVSPTRLRILMASDPRDGYGTLVRAALRDTTDPVLLTSAGWFLARSTRGPQLEFDPDAWAETCLRRAIALDPHAIFAHTALLRLRSQREFAQEPLWRVAPAAQYQTVSALPEVERFGQLAKRAREARMKIEDLSRWDDPNLRGRYDLARDDARRYADDALRLAPRHRDDPQYGTAIYVANMTLGALALDEGRLAEAADFLRKASRAPASEELTYADDIVIGVNWHLAADLLKHGERAAVADFADRMADVNLARRIELREAAVAIRRGETPLMFR